MRQGLRAFRYYDGGRAEAGFKGYAGYCAVRAIAIATRMPYKEVEGLIVFSSTLKLILWSASVGEQHIGDGRIV